MLSLAKSERKSIIRGIGDIEGPGLDLVAEDSVGLIRETSIRKLQIHLVNGSGFADKQCERDRATEVFESFLSEDAGEPLHPALDSGLNDMEIRCGVRIRRSARFRGHGVQVRRAEKDADHLVFLDFDAFLYQQHAAL